VSTTGTGAGLGAGQHSLLAFYRPFLPLFGTIFFCLLSVGASLATLPFWVTDRLGGGNLAVGFVVATIAVAAIVARPIAGRLADRRGYKPILMAGTLACAAAGALYFSALHVTAVLPIRLLHGIGEAAVYTAGAAWLVAICPPARRGRVVGLYGTAMWLGITLGALFGELLRNGAGFPAVWAFCLLMPLVGLALAASTPPPGQTGGAARPVLVPRGAVVPGIALSLASLGYGALAAFVALHLQHKGIAGGIAAFNAYGITYVAVRLLLGNWPDRFGPRRVAFWSGLVRAGRGGRAAAGGDGTGALGRGRRRAGHGGRAVAAVPVARADRDQPDTGLPAGRCDRHVHLVLGPRGGTRRPDRRRGRRPVRLPVDLLRHGRRRPGLRRPRRSAHPHARPGTTSRHPRRHGGRRGSGYLAPLRARSAVDGHDLRGAQPQLVRGLVVGHLLGAPLGVDPGQVCVDLLLHLLR